MELYNQIDNAVRTFLQNCLPLVRGAMKIAKQLPEHSTVMVTIEGSYKVIFKKQNPHKQSVWAKLARSGYEVIQVIRLSKQHRQGYDYLGIVVDGVYFSYRESTTEVFYSLKSKTEISKFIESCRPTEPITA